MFWKLIPKKVVHKAAGATGEFIGNKIADRIVKSKHVIGENLKNIEEIIILPKKEKNIKRVKASIIKIEHNKIFKLLND